MNNQNPTVNLDATILVPYLNALTGLHDALYNAYDGSSDAGKGDIFDMCYSLSRLITAINQAGIAADTGDLQELAPNIDALNKQLQAAEDQVNSWIKDVGTAVVVAKALDTALKLGISAFEKI